MMLILFLRLSKIFLFYLSCFLSSYCNKLQSSPASLIVWPYTYPYYGSYCYQQFLSQFQYPQCYYQFMFVINYFYKNLIFLQLTLIIIKFQNNNIMRQESQIKIIDFRNAIYQGQLSNGTFNNIGAILTQDFLFCLANWSNGSIEGPSFILFPNQNLFFGLFIKNQPQGLCCYQIGNQCSIYSIFQKGVMRRQLVADFPLINCLVYVQISENDVILFTQERNYQTTQQKWGTIGQIIKAQIPQNMKKYHKFIKKQYINKYKQIQQAFGQQYYLGFKGEGLGIKIDNQYLSISSVGYYDSNKLLKTLGKRIINRQKKVREQGIYSNPQTLIRYQQRPDKIKKSYRDYFRTSINFENRFLQLPSIQRIQKQFNQLKIKIKDSTTQKIAQQLIQHLEQDEIVQYKNNRSTNYNRTRTQSNGFSRNQNKQHSKMMADVTLQMLKDQLNRSMSNKKSKDKSPYKKYIDKPAQLKYSNKIYRQNDSKQQQNGNLNLWSRREYNYQYYTNQRKYPYKQVTRQLDFSPILKNHEINNAQNYKSYQKYPIQQNLRPINKYQRKSRSPIKVQKPQPKFKYYESDQNPEKQHYKIDNNKARTRFRDKTDHIGNNQGHSISPYGKLKTQYKRRASPINNQRVDKLSTLYDQIQVNKPYDNNRPSQYNLNHGRGYKFNQQDDLDKKMGYVTASRKVQQPIRKSRSPIKQYSYNQRIQQKYSSPIKQTISPYQSNYLKTRETKGGYRYFDKNR